MIIVGQLEGTGLRKKGFEKPPKKVAQQQTTRHRSEPHHPQRERDGLPFGKPDVTVVCSLEEDEG